MSPSTKLLALVNNSQRRLVNLLVLMPRVIASLHNVCPIKPFAPVTSKFKAIPDKLQSKLYPILHLKTYFHILNAHFDLIFEQGYYYLKAFA